MSTDASAYYSATAPTIKNASRNWRPTVASRVEKSRRLTPPYGERARCEWRRRKPFGRARSLVNHMMVHDECSSLVKWMVSGQQKPDGRRDRRVAERPGWDVPGGPSPIGYRQGAWAVKTPSYAQLFAPDHARARHHAATPIHALCAGKRERQLRRSVSASMHELEPALLFGRSKQGRATASPYVKRRNVADAVHNGGPQNMIVRSQYVSPNTSRPDSNAECNGTDWLATRHELSMVGVR